MVSFSKPSIWPFKASFCARKATSSTRWLSPVTELSWKLALVWASSACVPASVRSASSSALVFAASSASNALEILGELLFLGLERKQRRGLFAELELEAADRVALLADLRELVRGLRLHLLDAHFEPARGHGEFGAQLILVGLNFRHRERGERFQPPHGEAHGARMDQRNDADDEQARDKKPDPDKHDRFDHDAS